MPTMYDFFDPTNPEHLKALKSGPVGPSWRYLASLIDPSGLIGAESSYVAYTVAVRKLADHCLAQIEAKPQPDGESVTIRAVVFECCDGETTVFGRAGIGDNPPPEDKEILFDAREMINDGIGVRVTYWANIRVPLPQVPTVEVEAEVEADDA